MKHYEIQGVLSGGGRICDPVDAEDLESVKKIALERLPAVKEQLPLLYPGETIEAVEIYELVKVAAFNCVPKAIRRLS